MNAVKTSRGLSFAVIAGVYLSAAVLGTAVFRLLPYSFWLRLLIADVAATVWTFGFSVLFGNASVYDPYWSVQPIVILAALAVKGPLTAAGILLLLPVVVWGVRLTVNWAITFPGLNGQDWRYTMLREKTGARYPIVNFFGIHLFPTLVVYLCVLPAALVMTSGAAANPGSVIGAILQPGEGVPPRHAHGRRPLRPDRGGTRPDRREGSRSPDPRSGSERQYRYPDGGRQADRDAPPPDRACLNPVQI